ncbi:XRE family transcriptional regulator [Novosphingobium sp.]|uniref:XRE family transcriptional regulator n=1 Tax=Novosphingobium sp. TaxID=1874826 RepID=UPI00286E1796|nr:XRE family transcriptional regulator [Novosphingobium sp.]
MTDRPINVLLPMAMPTQKALRDAVANIIRAIQLDRDLCDEAMADALGISVGTVRNARNKKTDLNAVTIARIGARFGLDHLNPYAALYGARNSPLETVDIDALPSLSGAVHRLAVAQSPSSTGGIALHHSELLEMLPDLRTASAAINALIARAERIAA